MPNLARLRRDGSSGVLRSTIPYETGPAWTSFQTGCWPGKTGVFTFQSYRRQQRLLGLNSYDSIAVPTIWELADTAGKCVVSINMPVTSPPPRLKNGLVIPGLLCPSLSSETTWPPDAYEKYVAATAGYTITEVDTSATVKRFVDQQIAIERARCDMALRIMSDLDWDMFCIQIHATDNVQHHLWSTLDPTVDCHSPADRAETLRLYTAVDEIIGQLIARAGDDTLTVISSDHGFERLDKTVRLNVYLKQHGYLNIRSGAEPKPNSWDAGKEWLKGTLPLLRRIAIFYGQCCRRLRRAPASLWADSVMTNLRNMVDMASTTAFSLGAKAGLIYINASQPSRREIAARLAEELLSDLGPDSSSSVISAVRPGIEVYGSVEDDSLPDLVAEYAEGVWGLIECSGDTVVQHSEPAKGPVQLLGTHSADGIFVFCGPNVKAGQSFDADIVDILPTILPILSLSIPNHLDGRVLTEAFDQLRPPDYKDFDHSAGSSSEYTQQEKDQIERKLGDLGYM